MSDIFGDLRKQAKDNNKRWERMDVLLEKMREDAAKGLLCAELPEFLELLVKNVRPNVNVEGEIADLEKAMGGIAKAFGKQK